MAQNMKLSIIGQTGEKALINVNINDTFIDFQEKLLKEHNLNITIEDFQLFFANLTATVNFFSYLKENLNIDNLDNQQIFEINLFKGFNDIKRERFNSFTENNEIENSLLELNQSIFESTSFPENKKLEDLYPLETNSSLFIEDKLVKKQNTGDCEETVKESLNSTKNNEQISQSYDYMEIESKLAEIHECSEENLLNFCRLCAKSITENNKIQLYNDENDSNEKLDEKINRCLPIKIKKEDGLPQQICNSCTDNLKNFCDFVQIVIKADKVLKKKFLNCISENETSVSDFMSEFLSSSPDKPFNTQTKLKHEPEESDNSDNNFETEYLEMEQVSNTLNNQNCRRCDLMFKSFDEAVAHGIKSHCINNLYACVFCEFGFSQTSTFIQHMTMEHRSLFSEENRKIEKDSSMKSSMNKSVHCEVCNQAFSSKVRLNFHRQFHLKDVRPLFCSSCNLTFNSEDNLFDHFTIKHNSKQLHSCDVCNKTFSIRSALHNHKKNHHGIRNHKCNLCHKSFFDKQTLKEHEVIHMETKPYQCHICGKNLNRLSRLRRHLLTHESSPVVNDVPVCNICEEAFSDATAANLHQTSQHDNKSCIDVISTDKVFRCEFCEKCYSTPKALNEHRAIHSSSTPFICHICKAQFSSYSRCTTHKTTHGLYKDGAEKDSFPVVKHFLCEFCGKSYLHWTYLGLHRRLKHTDNIYKCDKCDLEFLNCWSLSYHRKTKHNQESLKCVDCGKVLSNEQSLKLHRLTKHSDQKNKDVSIKPTQGFKEYKCSLCPKSFINFSGLSNHMKQHKKRKFVFPTKISPDEKSFSSNSDRPFPCDLCGLSFRKQFALRNHKLKHNKATDSSGFVLMVDMKEDEGEKKIAEQPIQYLETLEDKAIEPQMNFIQLAGQDTSDNYIDIGNGNYLQLQGNTFNIDGKEYILVDDSAKSLERNQEYEMIVDETLRVEEPANETNLVTSQFDNSTVMLVEPDNSYLVDQNDLHSDFIYNSTDKTITKTVTSGATTYIIEGNDFLLQNNQTL